MLFFTGTPSVRHLEDKAETVLFVQDSVSIFQEQLMGWKRKLETPAGKPEGLSAEGSSRVAARRPQPSTGIQPSPAAEAEGSKVPTEVL